MAKPSPFKQWLKEHLATQGKLIITVLTGLVVTLVILACVKVGSEVRKKLFEPDSNRSEAARDKPTAQPPQPCGNTKRRLPKK